MTTADIKPGAEPVPPADELRAAAAKLRETAGEIVNVNGGGGFEKWIQFYSEDSEFMGGMLDGRDLGWIALVHPGLAKPLADWLADVAADVENHDPDDGCECIQSESFHRAYDIARVINGSTP